MAVRIAAAAESDTTNMTKPARAGAQKTSGRSPTIRRAAVLDELDWLLGAQFGDWVPPPQTRAE